MTFEQRLGENKGGFGKMTSATALRWEFAWFFEEERRDHYGHMKMSEGEHYMERANGSHRALSVIVETLALILSKMGCHWRLLHRAGAGCDSHKLT